MAAQPGIQIVYNTPIEATGAAPSAPPMEAGQSGFNPNLWTQSGPTQLEGLAQAEPTSLEPSSGDGFKNALCAGKHLKTLFMTILSYGGLIWLLIGLGTGNGSFVVGGAVALGVGVLSSLIELFCCASTGKYLKNILSKDETLAHMRQMTTVAPTFWWTIQNYHYVTEYYTDSDGNRKSRQRRVNTHFASGHFIYSVFRDTSLGFPNLAEYMLTKLKLKVQGVFGDQLTASEYDRQMNYFRSTNIRDTHHDFNSGVRLEGMRPKILCEAEPGARHDCMDYKWFVITGLVGCSFVYRVWMSSLTGRCTFYFKKDVFCMPHIAPAQVVTVAPPMPQPNAVVYDAPPAYTKPN